MPCSAVPTLAISISESRRSPCDSSITTTTRNLQAPPASFIGQSWMREGKGLPSLRTASHRRPASAWLASRLSSFCSASAATRLAGFSSMRGWRPRMSSREQSIMRRKASDANTTGLSSMPRSHTRKAWSRRSTVVARSIATRGRRFLAPPLPFLPPLFCPGFLRISCWLSRLPNEGEEGASSGSPTSLMPTFNVISDTTSLACSFSRPS
mmetsp:Transcript_5134/g.12985  ORF Transcript_5134/g.12985 Transcript_5134/m.12985 type:complete len:210 (+) Transcript_5134:1369-1998(+)